MIVGIDASHIVGGGALGHLKLLLKNYKKSNSKISKIFIWAPRKTLECLIEDKSIIKCYSIILEFNYIFKFFWQFFFLKINLKKKQCDVLFVPTGIFYTNFKPVVTMAQNLMPFDKKIVKKHFPYPMFFKMIIQKYLFIKSFNKADKVIFLSNYSKNYINYFLSKFKKDKDKIIIPHAIDSNIIKYFRNKKIPNTLKKNKEIKICLLSDINFNKNYKQVLQSISMVKKKYNIKFFWIGGKNKILMNRFNKYKNFLDINKNFIIYKGLMKHKKTINFIYNSDIFLYSSNCETFGVTVLEGMASKLPIIILKHPLYKEILGNNAFFFKENNSKDLCKKIILAIEKTFKYKILYKKNYTLLKNRYSEKKLQVNTLKILEASGQVIIKK